MKVLMPLFRAGTGNDVYFESIKKAVGDIDVTLDYYPKLAGFIPLPCKKRTDPAGYDVIHTNAEGGHRFREPKKPFIVTAHHNVFDKAYDGYRTRTQRAYHTHILRGYIKKSFSYADAIVTHSEYQKRSFEAAYPGYELKAIPCGIDTAYFKPLEGVKDPFPGRIKLLFVGTPSRRKGADLLPRIMERLDDRFILLATTDGLNIPGKASSLGRLDSRGLLEAYNSCDLLLFPTRFEGFGLTVAEAMACGKPVVSTDCSSIPELVDDGKGGFLCRVDDVDGYADKIRYLADNPSEMRRMGEHNRKSAQERFSLERFGRDYRRLYQEYAGGDSSQ
jgi:glycosyltransferase involved in cell wall biosynthesis